jgi:hypothetical protein
MESSPPKCPRCPDGGRVELVAGEDDKPIKTIFSPPPGQSRKTEVFQCKVCGWTLMRMKPKPETE